MKEEPVFGVPAQSDPDQAEEFVCSVRASRTCVHASCLLVFLALTLLMLVIMERERRLDLEAGIITALEQRNAETMAFVMYQH